jgi:DNA-binding PadR family transcriptional regulator
MGHPGFSRQQWMDGEQNGGDRPWRQHRGGERGRGRGRGGPWGDWGGGPGRAGRPGPPPWVAGIFGLGQDEQRRGPRVRRGDVRSAILDVLAVEPMNGYQIIQQIAERSGGAWKPSPGSVYPTVQQLEDEGLVEGTEGAGRRLLQLSEEGRSYVAEHPDELAATWRPFDQPEADEGPGDLKPVIGQVMGAVWQVVVSGTKQQQAEAAEILAETRRKLYGILAEGDEGEEGTAS